MVELKETVIVRLHALGIGERRTFKSDRSAGTCCIPDVMFVELIPETACVRKRSNRFNCVAWKNASINTPGWTNASGIVTTCWSTTH